MLPMHSLLFPPQQFHLLWVSVVPPLGGQAFTSHRWSVSKKAERVALLTVWRQVLETLKQPVRTDHTLIASITRRRLVEMGAGKKEVMIAVSCQGNSRGCTLTYEWEWLIRDMEKEDITTLRYSDKYTRNTWKLVHSFMLPILIHYSQVVILDVISVGVCDCQTETGRLLEGRQLLLYAPQERVHTTVA